MSVAANIAEIRESIGEKPVKLIAVTKSATNSQIEEAFCAGVTEFGESKIQDAVSKLSVLSPSLVQNSNWHFIGHLQRNKVKQAVGNFDLIHSIDSLRLAEEVSSVAGKQGRTQAVLLQVKILADPGKGGFTPDELRACFSSIISLPGIEVRGLMTISPYVEDEKIWSACFTGLRELRDELKEKFAVPLEELSMGMTDDWRCAISCGSTMIRVGRAIFDS